MKSGLRPPIAQSCPRVFMGGGDQLLTAEPLEFPACSLGNLSLRHPMNHRSADAEFIRNRSANTFLQVCACRYGEHTALDHEVQGFCSRGRVEYAECSDSLWNAIVDDLFYERFDSSRHKVPAVDDDDLFPSANDVEIAAVDVSEIASAQETIGFWDALRIVDRIPVTLDDARPSDFNLSSLAFPL